MMMLNMIRTHGLRRGMQRYSEELIENRWFDLRNGTETSGIVTHGDFYSMIGQKKEEGAMWYQPTYTTPLVEACRFLRSLPLHGKMLFIDLGVGKGKPCIIAAQQFSDCAIMGVDLSPELLAICRRNLAQYGQRVTLLQANVLDVEYDRLFQGYDTVIVHNKNSFDAAITGAVLEKILAAKGEKAVFYIYNNPVYKDLFTGQELLFARDGWHKNHRLHLYRL